ncbi:hypothetical protein E8E11_000053, partial [Didymella keratinophila]
DAATEQGPATTAEPEVEEHEDEEMLLGDQRAVIVPASFVRETSDDDDDDSRSMTVNKDNVFDHDQANYEPMHQRLWISLRYTPAKELKFPSCPPDSPVDAVGSK